MDFRWTSNPKYTAMYLPHFDITGNCGTYSCLHAIKVERYQRTPKGEINQIPYEMPSELRQAIESFVKYYDNHRYHEALGNVTPADVCHDRRRGILAKREEAKRRTLLARKEHNRNLRELD